MTKIDELKAAWDAATPGEWDFVVADNAEHPFCSVVQRDEEGYEEVVIATTNSAEIQEQTNATFIALAHNMMLALLDAANHLAECQELLHEYPWAYQKCKQILKEFK